MNIVAVGGDLRQRYAAEALREKGHSVAACLLGGDDAPCVEALLADCDVLLLPMPLSRGGGVLNAPLHEGQVLVEDVLRSAPPGTVVLAGMPGAGVEKTCAELGLHLVDYAPREEIAASGAVSTAEAALALMVENMPCTLAGSRILVVGAGRIGTRLALSMQQLGARVTVSARKAADLARINAVGLTAVPTDSVAEYVSAMDAVVNTVPAPVLDENCLRRMSRGALLLDLASAPGGVAAPRETMTHIKYVWALGLPGKTAPATAGRAVAEAVDNILKEPLEG